MSKFIIKKNKGLNRVLSIYFLIIFTLFGFIGGSIFVYLEKSRVIDFTKRTLRQSSTNLIKLLSYNPDYMVKELKLFNFKMNHIHYLIISEGEITYTTDKRILGVDLNIDKLGEINKINIKNDKVFITKLILRKTEYYFFFFQSDVFKNINEIQIRIFVISLILAFVTIFFSWFFISRYVLKPIKVLSKEASDFDFQKVDIYKRDDEIGTLAKSLCSMAETIKAQLMELKEHKNNLEQLVDKRTEELEKTLLELVETKKMAALGELVSGVAHEINTPVGIGVTASTHLQDIVKNLLTLYEKNLISKSRFEESIKEISETSGIIYSNMAKAATLIKGFKEIAVDQTVDDIRSFNLKEYIDEILMSIHSEIKNCNHIINVECPDNITITSHPGAISQILTNMIFNSLKHGFEGVDSGIISISGKKVDDTIILEYEDNGIGLSEEVLKRIYDPFFTTKRGDGGTGLGMNIVFNLIKKSLRGSIKCKSEKGSGVLFIIEFPSNIN